MNMKDVQQLFPSEDGNQLEQVTFLSYAAKFFSISPYTDVKHLDYILQAFESALKKMGKEEIAYVL